jgi:hypothetical protein
VKASEAQDGCRYILPASNPKHSLGILECVGWNHSHEWLLFVYFDCYHHRKIVMLFPSEEIAVL